MKNPTAAPAVTSSRRLSRRAAALRLGTSVAAATFAGGVAAALLPAGTAAAAPAGLAVVSPRPAVPAGVLALGPLQTSQVIRGEVALKPRDPAALSRYVSLVSEPRSPLYHRYLRPGQFTAEFGPSASSVRAVTSALARHGVSVTGVSPNRLLVHFSGTAAHVSAAFDTGFERYRLADARTVFASTAAATMPAAVAPDVEGVIGLNDLLAPQAVGAPLGPSGASGAHSSTASGRATPSGRAAPAAGAKGDGPAACNAADAIAAQYGGYTQQQVARAYGLDPLYEAGADGTGQTIAVYELQPFSMTNLEAFDTCYFGAARAARIAGNVTVVPVDGGQQVGEGNPPEAALDLDDVTAVAPGAHIEVYEAPSTFVGLIDNFNAIVTEDTAQTATSSWFSGCESLDEQMDPGLLQVEDDIFQQAAAQGQTFLEASGDDGSDGCAEHSVYTVPPVLSQQAEAAQPYVLSVGGTTMSADTTPPAEQVWNDGSSGGAGGGGPSAAWPAPAWQVDSGVPGTNDPAAMAQAEAVNGAPFCSATLCREVPDVSALADELTGITIYAGSASGGWSTIGGTSSAAPLWAAMLADIDSTAACKAEGGVGFVNPKLYAVAAVPAEYKAAFNDVTSGNNDVFGAVGGLFSAGSGFDMASGLGTPKVTGTNGSDGLAYYLCSPGAAPTPVVTGVSPDAVTSRGGSVVISGSGFENGATDDVAGVQVGTVALSPSQYSVTGPTTIEATLPASAAESGTGTGTDGAGDEAVTVTLSDGQTSTPTPAARVIYYPASNPAGGAPEVYGVTSDGNNEAGGETATVYGAGFETGSTPSVTFGGVAAGDVAVLSDTELTATVPAWSPATTCRQGDHPAFGVCQVEVRVTTAAGSSPQVAISRIFSGDLSNEGQPGTGETLPAATEFDYFPTPQITSISLPPYGSASEFGDSEAIVKGVGLDEIATDWLNVGPYTSTDSIDATFLSMTSREDVILLPGHQLTRQAASVPVTVQTEGSLNNGGILGAAPSNTALLTYAPNPVVTSVTALHDGVASPYSAGPTTGGTQLDIAGTGLSGSFGVVFLDEGAFTYSTDTSLGSVGPTEVTMRTPASAPSVNAVLVCNATACSASNSAKDSFTYFEPGAPTLSSISQSRGRAGTVLTLHGSNLGFAKAVYFGSVKASRVANYPTLLDSGSTTRIQVLVPKLAVGMTYDVRVVTLESEVTGSGESRVNPKVTFTCVK